MGYRQSRKVGGAKHPQASNSGYCRSAREQCRVHTEANGSVMVGAWRNWVCHWLVQVPNQIGFQTTRISKRTCADHLPVRRWSSNLAQSQRFWLPPAKLHAPSPVGERVTGRRTTEQQIFHSRFRRVNVSANKSAQGLGYSTWHLDSSTSHPNTMHTLQGKA